MKKMLSNKLKYMLVILPLSLIYSNIMAKDRLSISTGATYLTGDYGGSESTDIYYVPFTIKYKLNRFNFKITIPYLEKTGLINVIQDIGQTGQQITSTRTTESGLGNIILAARYNFYYHPEYKFLMDIEGKVNIGTASESRGLGTGKTDYSFRLGLYKVIDALTPYAKIGFKVYGSPQLNDAFYLSSGFSYKVFPSISAGLDFSWREQVSKTGTEKRQLTGFSSQKITKNWRLQEYIIRGFGRSTAEWGGGLSITYVF